MSNESIIIISSVISAVISVLITNYLHYRNEKVKAKKDVLLQLLANRHHIRSDAFTQALNSIIIVFHDDNKIIECFKTFIDEASATQRSQINSDQKLLNLFKAMVVHLKMSSKILTDNYYLMSFNPK